MQFGQAGSVCPALGKASLERNGSEEMAANGNWIRLVRNRGCFRVRRALSVVLLAATMPVSAVSSAVAQVPLPSPDIRLQRETFDPNRPARPAAKPYRGPIIDTHVHFRKGLDGIRVSGVLGRAHEAGVTRIIALPTPNEGLFRDSRDNAAARRRVIERGAGAAARLCGSTYLTRWMHTAFRAGYEEKDLQARLDRLRADIESGGCLGIGEIGPYHFDKKAGQANIQFPLNFEPVLRLAALAVELDVWLDLHMEPLEPDGTSHEEAVFGGIALLFRHSRDLKLILSHTAMTNARNARALLDAYPNLMMNLKMVRPGSSLRWQHLGPISNQDDELFEDWAQLFEAMPERFMIGTDARFGEPQYQGKRYHKTIKRLRRALGSLNPSAAELIANGNANRLFFGADLAAR